MYYKKQSEKKKKKKYTKKQSVKINEELEWLSELNKLQNNQPMNLSCHLGC